MQLRIGVFVAFGPLLITCLGDDALANLIDGGTGSSVAVPTPAPIVAQSAPPTGNIGSTLSNVEAAALSTKCPKIPMMPATFTAKRKFTSFTNVIEFFDRHGQGFGFVQSWFIDWRNPFGYPGASFYLKAPPQKADQGVWKIDPKIGEFGWNAPAPASSPEGLKQEEAEKLEYDREFGSGAFDARKYKAFLAGVFGDNDAILAGSMVGPIPRREDPFKEELTVRDCHDYAKFVAKDGEIFSANTRDSIYDTKLTDTANELNIGDLSIPTAELVRVTMAEPCTPFPPFCAKMGMWTWLIYGDKWEGEIVQPGYDLTTGTGLMEVTNTAGAGTDMRFLALYSAYQFSNTRWSPLMMIVIWVLSLSICCFCCGPCCYRCCCGSKNNAVAESDRLLKSGAEETEKLMKTVEADASSFVQEKPKSGIFNCCSRRQPNFAGSTVMPSH